VSGPGKTDLLFINRRGRPFSANKLREKVLHPLLERLGIPRGGFHSMRHGATSAPLADGATPASLNIIVQIERRPGTRFVSEVLQIRGYEPEADRYDFCQTYCQSGK
jgi:hypothetical protein